MDLLSRTSFGRTKRELLFRPYRELVTPDQARRWWDIPASDANEPCGKHGHISDSDFNQAKRAGLQSFWISYRKITRKSNSFHKSLYLPHPRRLRLRENPFDGNRAARDQNLSNEDLVENGPSCLSLKPRGVAAFGPPVLRNGPINAFCYAPSTMRKSRSAPDPSASSAFL